MQFCKVEVQLSGDMTNTVIKSGVSVPEIVLLREIHGGISSVRVLEVEGKKTVPHREELLRLNALYSSAADTDGKLIVSRTFPGVGVRLSETLEDISDPFIFGESFQEQPEDTDDLVMETPLEPVASKSKK